MDHFSDVGMDERRHDFYYQGAVSGFGLEIGVDIVNHEVAWISMVIY